MTDLHDYIVVGGGAAGSIVASRLSAAGAKVLLLEAGGTDRRLDVVIPAGAGSAYSHASWDYPIEPDPNRTNKPEGVMAGKILGGGGSINSCVYIRGNRVDFDNWAALGCDGWDYDSVLPFFKRLETWEGGANAFRGGGGPISVVEQKDRGRANAAYFAAARQAGYPLAEDYNGADQEGAAYTQVNMRRGLRSQASREYLKRVASPSNLTVRLNATAHRLLFEGDRAIGIEYHHENELKPARAGQEVILSAGSYATPKLLMLSGIGPREDLERHGLGVLAHSPGVGQNLHDHPFVMMRWRSRIRTINRMTAGMMLKGVWDLLVHGRGLLSQTVVPVLVQAKSDPGAPKPDLQLYFTPFAISKEVDENGVFKVGLGKEDGFTAATMLLDTRTRGSVRLRSASPQDTPLINYHFLEDPEDLRLMMHGLREVRRIMSQPAMAALTNGQFEAEENCKTDDDWKHYARMTAGSTFHPVGTCKMGVDDLAVVDPRLRVRGVRGLRVIDASIMPQITSGNTNSPSMMIGERGADLVLNSQ